MAKKLVFKTDFSLITNGCDDVKHIPKISAKVVENFDFRGWKISCNFAAQICSFMKKILGVGNALVDVIVNIPDESLLQSYSLPKGGMEMIDCEKKRNLHQSISTMNQVLASGGSTSNTIHGLARLGQSAGYIGKVGCDSMGRFFEDDMKKSGIRPHLVHTSEMDTGIATTLMTNDAERTFATYLGAAASMDSKEIDSEIFNDYDFIHVEGYLIFNHDLILRICQMAKEKGLRISMDMASFNLVEEHHDFISMLLKDYVSVVFANEEEAQAFTGLDGEAALDVLSKYCDVCVVKMGKNGSVANVFGQKVTLGTSGVIPVDTNGAGDAYAAGFLYGLLNQFAPEKMIRFASRIADEAIVTVGAKLSDEQWNTIRNEKEWF